MDRKKLKIAMIQANIKNVELAAALGISKGALQYKLNGQREFRANELKKMFSLLNLTQDQFFEIFFA